MSPSSNFRGDLEVWDVDSSSPPSVSAIGRVSAKVSSVEQLAEEKLLHEQWSRSDVLEVSLPGAQDPLQRTLNPKPPVRKVSLDPESETLKSPGLGFSGI